MRRWSILESSRLAVGIGIVTAAWSASACAQGNAFFPPAGGGTIAVSSTIEYYENFWRGNVEVSDPALGRVDTGSVTVWMQAGLATQLALVANIAYVDVRGDGFAGLRDQGLQNAAFLLRYRALDRTLGSWRHRVVVGAGARFPASGYDPDSPVALGDGTKDTILNLVYQLQIEELWGTYLAVAGGYDARDTAPNVTLLYGELGATFGRLTLSGIGMSARSDGGSDIGDPGFTYPGLREDWMRVGGKAYYRVSPTLGLAVSGFTTLAGRNTGRCRGLSTSLIVNLPAPPG